MSDSRIVLSDAGAVALRAVSLFKELASEALASRGSFRVALSGGTTPVPFFRGLVSDHEKDISWEHIEIFWVDERCVPPDNEESNFRSADMLLMTGACVPAGNLHRIKGELSPEKAAEEYESELRKIAGPSGFPEFDLVVLGVGEDGHTASLFPNAPSLSEQNRTAVPVYVERLRSWRITLTLPVINNASHILFLVTGPEKAGIVRELFSDKTESRIYPAGLVRPLHGEVTWLLDIRAASLLQ